MATNGESARKWLEENRDKVPVDRILKIRDNLSSKLQTLEDSDDGYPGLLEALDIMDSHLLERGKPETEIQNSDSFPDTLMDSGPLISDSDDDVPILSSDEKKNRFQNLLKSSKFN